MNPCVIVEVLSKSTASRDRGWKLQNYCKIPSLIDYVLVSQDRPFVEHFVRRPEGNWMFEFMEGLDFSLKLAAIELTIPLREIYLDVQFGPEEGDELA
jgi:Uma2 family endonuclease